MKYEQFNEDKVQQRIPEYTVEPITHDQLCGELDYLNGKRFLESLLSDGKITHDEFNKILQKMKAKFSPLYPEIRA